jgi:RNA-splicing ligase RtcB
VDIITDKLYSWAVDLENEALLQALATSRLPIIEGHVALMPDAHFGLGSTVGSVLPTRGAIIPAAVGVDVGCGLAGVRTDLVASDLPDTLDPLIASFETAVPAGVGNGHEISSNAVEAWLADHKAGTEFDNKQRKTAATQLGTLGGGNHFVEVDLDQNDGVWLVLHSGSRGIGNQLARKHIDSAKAVMKRAEIGLEDPDLAYFLEGTPEFEAYMADLLWGQEYARANRDFMMTGALRALFRYVGKGRERERIDSHHNYTSREVHGGQELWITRKGAVSAKVGERGIIPGSMGTSTFIVSGLGNPDSYDSCSHGAGRKMSRGRAKRELSVESLVEAMDGKAWNADKAQALLDEHPDSYKSIQEVMAAQADLVEITHELNQVLNFKGTR